MMPPTMNLRDAYQQGKDDEQNFIQNLALFLVTILKEHGSRQFEVDGLKVIFQVDLAQYMQTCIANDILS